MLIGFPVMPRSAWGTLQPEVICLRSSAESQTVSARSCKAPRQIAMRSSLRITRKQAAGSPANPERDLPGGRSVRRDHTAPLPLRGDRQVVRFAVGRFQCKMMMPMPTTTRQPEAQGVVLGRIPLEFEPIRCAGIADGRSPLGNGRDKDFLTTALRDSGVHRIRPG